MGIDEKSSMLGDDLPNLDRVRAVVQLLHKDDAVAALLRSCNEIGEAFLFGGMARDALMGSKSAWGDVDIFVSGPINVEFARSLSRCYRRTNFGGMRLVVGKFDIDIWELHQSYAFRIEKGRSISIPSLLETVCFSSDAIAVSLLDPKRVVTTSKFRSTVKERVLQFVVAPLGVEILQSVRAARLLVKLDLIPDIKIARYFLSSLQEFGIKNLVKAEEKWKGRRVLDEFLIDKVRDLCESVVRDEVSETLAIDAGLFGGK